MKLNNKGFALTSMIYMLIVLFIMIILLLLANLATRKVVLDKLKNDVKIKLDQGVSVNASELPYLNITNGIYYETLDLAIAGADSGDTIRLLKNLSDESTPTIIQDKEIKIDLAGNELTLNKKITNSGTLDIYSSVDGGTIINPINNSITNNGTLTLNGTSADHTLNIINNSTIRTAMIYIINNTGTATLNDNVTITYSNNGVSGNAARYIVSNAGTLTVNGATLINNMDRTANESGITMATTAATSSNVTFNYGTIETSGTGIYNYASTKNTIADPAIKIAGGTIKSSANYAIYNTKQDSMVYITGGELISMSNNVINTNGNVTMTDGTIYAYGTRGIYMTNSASLTMTGGTIIKDKNPETNTWKSGGCIHLTNTAQATIKGTSILQAELGNSSKVIENAGTGTITIEENAYIENKDVQITIGSTNSGKIIVNNGTIKSGGSSVLSNSYSSSTSTNFGTLEINGGTLTTTGSQAISNTSAYAEINIYGGTITATGTSNSYGTINSTMANSKITIAGGKIEKPNKERVVNVTGADSSLTITGGELSTPYIDAIYLNGSGVTATIGTEGAESNTYPKIDGRINGNSSNTGLITINSGTITGTTNNAITSKKNITINGGEISSTGSAAVYVTTASAKITVNGGNISANNIAVGSTDTVSATIEINGGTIRRTAGTTGGAVQSKLGSITIKGGTITSTGYGVLATTGTIIIGDDDGIVSPSNPSITGLYGVSRSSGTINFYDGIITGTNGNGSSIKTATAVPPTNYEAIRTLNGTTETTTLQPQ